MKVLIVGGVAGGASTAARLRRLQEDANIIMFERGEYVSFANCGLPYYIGNVISDKEALTLQTPESFKKRFNIDVRILQEVIAINREKHTVTVRNVETQETYEESYDRLVLSPGAAPIIPDIKGIDKNNVFTLRNIPDTYRIKEYIDVHHPNTATIIGGGFIGLEMAENLMENGVAVTIIEAANQVASVLDEEMSIVVSNYITGKGIKIVKEHLVLDLEEIESDMIILSVGVQPESELAKKAKLKLTSKGAIQVNEYLQTSDPDIYAIGDAIEVKHRVSQETVYIPLAGPANKQGRIVGDNLSGKNRAYRSSMATSIMKIFDMTVATTGLNEKTLKRLDKRYEKVYLWANNHATYYPDAKSMLIKVLFDKEDGTIYGGQIVGHDGVDKRIDVLATAIYANLKASDLCELELAYAPPYSAAKDPINMIGFMIDNVIHHKVKQFHFDDYETLQQRQDVIFLDVRTKQEYANGAIVNTIHIPVDELRERLQELDKGKIIYVNCQSGLRSYIAYRILSQHGFTCYHLAGGYRLYDEIYYKNQSLQKSTYTCGQEIK